MHKNHNKQINKRIITNVLQKSNSHKKLITQGEKAYKILAMQQNISLKKAKNLIDMGYVSVNNKRLTIARTILPINTQFHIIESHFEIIFEDNDILAIEKGVGIESYSLECKYPNYKLINRLDKDTSGILLMAKNERIRQQAIHEFKNQRVQKKYFALVEGKIFEELIINKNIITHKGTRAKSHIATQGLEAITKVKPLQLLDDTTLLEIEIPTGRTHQIRIHLAHIKHPIIGDIVYNKQSKKPAKRLMLHCYATSIMHYNIHSISQINEIFGIKSLIC